MSIGFKILADVDTKDAIGAGANVLVEDNGAIYRVPAEKVGGGNSGGSTPSPQPSVGVKTYYSTTNEAYVTTLYTDNECYYAASAGTVREDFLNGIVRIRVRGDEDGRNTPILTLGGVSMNSYYGCCGTVVNSGYYLVGGRV